MRAPCGWSPVEGWSMRRTWLGTLTIAAPGQGNAWAVGNDGHSGLVEHWDGTAWTRVTVPDPNAGNIYGSRLTAISARSASDIWAVGTYGNPAPNPDSLYTLHFDGTA